MLVGMGLSAWLVRAALRRGVVDLPELGFRAWGWTLPAALVAAVFGFLFLALQRPASTNSIVVLNVFAQVWPTSVAEVVLCWAAVGAVLEAFLRRRGQSKLAAMMVAVLAADVLFGVYHFAHSAPFNQLRMVVFLMVPGLVTSFVYFLGRDIYATAVFHNFLGLRRHDGHCQGDLGEIGRPGGTGPSPGLAGVSMRGWSPE